MFGVLNTRTGDLGQPTEEMGARPGKLVAADEVTAATESLLDVIVMEHSQSDGRLADPTGTNESDGCEVPCQAKDLLYQFATSEAGPRWRWRRFPEYTRCKYKIMSRRVL